MKRICILILFLLGFSISSKAQIHLGFGAPGVQHEDTVEYGDFLSFAFWIVNDGPDTLIEPIDINLLITDSNNTSSTSAYLGNFSLTNNFLLPNDSLLIVSWDYLSPQSYMLGDNIVVIWPSFVSPTTPISYDIFTGNLFVSSISSVQERISNESLLIYPNPIVEKATIKTSDFSKIENFRMLDITGKTIKENLSDLPGLTDGQKIIFPLDNPIKPSGHIRILKGNLAPGGSVAKITGKEGEIFTGPAKVYDSEEAMLSSLENNEIIKGDVIIIRYEGPKGGPGMPEMLTPTSAIIGAGLGNDVAMITDGRFSGGSHGFIIGHVVPEAQEGGPIAIIKNGDIVTINAKTNKIEFKLSDKEFANRQKNWKMPPYKANRGTLYKYIKNVKTASEGCVTDE